MVPADDPNDTGRLKRRTASARRRPQPGRGFEFRNRLLPLPRGPPRQRQRKKRVLFVCIGNSCRSQMAEAFARAYGSDVLEFEARD